MAANHLSSPNLSLDVSRARYLAQAEGITVQDPTRCLQAANGMRWHRQSSGHSRNFDAFFECGYRDFPHQLLRLLEQTVLVVAKQVLCLD